MHFERQLTLEDDLKKRLISLEAKIDKVHEELKSLHETRTQVKLLWAVFTAALIAAVTAFIKLFTK
jgi:hypothetical protein